MRDAVALRRVYLASRMSISQNLQLRPEVDALLGVPATVLHASWGAVSYTHLTLPTNREV